MFDSEQLAMGFVAINYVGSIINLSALWIKACCYML